MLNFSYGKQKPHHPNLIQEINYAIRMYLTVQLAADIYLEWKINFLFIK